VETSNFAKFQTKNPIVRRLIDRFYDRLRAMVEPLEPESVLDAGCGEGETIARLGDALPRSVWAIDVLEESVAYTKRRLPFVEASRQGIYNLAFADDAFDLVLCLEVLEHLDRPVDALRELSRISRGELLLSVPYEPYFRVGSLLRGKHLRRLGNHPEHVNHWGRRTFADFARVHLDVVRVTVSFPWLIAQCRPRPQGG
jgi:2-polyprenyl-3-methyl-5-hydroxy-6-metoxy-1,4-benzoquinol methylase